MENFEFLDQINPKRIFLISKGKQKKNHHRILHLFYIRISLGSKVQPQQIIYIIWNKFAKRKNTSGQKINITIESFIFK